MLRCFLESNAIRFNIWSKQCHAGIVYFIDVKGII